MKTVKYLKTIAVMLAGMLQSQSSGAQQWIDQQYAYDSILNVPYGTALRFTGDVDTLTMDIYWPVCGDSAHVSKRPLLVWIHGGAFLEGNKEDISITNFCKQFAQRGYVTASINYRLGFVSDDIAWSCNYPNYSCVFATDTAEWYRAYFRGVQDGKGAIRYLVNRYAQYQIDTSNIFVAGESAGALLALGVGLLDTISEKFPQAYAISNVPAPNTNTSACTYNAGTIFGSPISRPDLGSIDGDLEPTAIQFTIKGIGNMYGAMLNDLLKEHPVNKPKPAIFSFHQACDLVVPIDSGRVFAGLSWCFGNGYNCYGIAHTAKLYGSKAFNRWNTLYNYGYNIHNEFAGVAFPYSFLFGQGSCLDQINNPCHAFDNRTLRGNNLASFFSLLVTSSPACDTSATTIVSQPDDLDAAFTVFPNPVHAGFTIVCDNFIGKTVELTDILGRQVKQAIPLTNQTTHIDTGGMPAGIYFLICCDRNGTKTLRKMVKE